MKKQIERKPLILLSILSLLFLAENCKQEEIVSIRDYPRIDISDEIRQSDSGVTFTAMILTDGLSEILDMGFVWHPRQTPTIDGGPRISAKPGVSTEIFKATTTYDLTAGVTYSVRAYIQTREFLVYSRIISFHCEFSTRSIQFTDFNPKIGIFGDTVLLSGKNFSYSPDSIEVVFNNNPASVVASTDTTIHVLVPNEISSPESIIKIDIGSHSQSYDIPFALKPPSITGVNPNKASQPETRISILGESFNPVPGNNYLFLGEHPAVIEEATLNELVVDVYSSVVSDPEITVQKTLPISLSIAGQTTYSPDSLIVSYQGRWTRMNDFPGPLRTTAVALEADGKGYYGLGINKSRNEIYSDLWEYNSETDTWNELTSLPGNPRAFSAAFAIDHKIYISCGTVGNKLEDATNLNEIWEYDTRNDSWTRRSDFPGIARHSAEGFSIGDLGYLVGGMHGEGDLLLEMWEYNPVADQWKQMGNIPSMPDDNIREISVIETESSGFIVARSDRHDIDYGRLWKYDPINAEWGRREMFQYGPSLKITGFSINDSLYCGALYYNPQFDNVDFFAYNSTDNRWRTIGFKGPERYHGQGFALNGMGYIFGGTADSAGPYLSDVWRFDPGK